jgi:serine/threonine-protein kinase HipA
MVEEVQVFVQIAGEDVHAGRLWPHRRRQVESATFRYSADYIGRDGAYQLDPSLPFGSGSIQTPAGRAIFGAFSDCAPDRWGRTLIRRRQRKAHGSLAEQSYGEADYLLGARDDLRQGALRFRSDDDGPFLAVDNDGVPDLLELPELLNLADRAERDEADETELEILLRGGSSLGGARPKAHVRDAEGRISIAKFPKPEGDEWDISRWESVALKLARGAGIVVADSELREIDGRSVLIVSRFDRRGDLRIGYVSAMTMLEATDGDQRSYLEIAEAIEDSSAQVTEDLRQLWRRIAFTVLIRNTDDHLRNHGFLRTSSSGWSLSPAFDLNPNPARGNSHLSTSIDGSSDAASLELLLDNAEYFRLTDAEARSVLHEVGASTGRWRHVAAGEGIVGAEIGLMEPAFEHQSAQWLSGISKNA